MPVATHYQAVVPFGISGGPVAALTLFEWIPCGERSTGAPDGIASCSPSSGRMLEAERDYEPSWQKENAR